MFRANGLRFKDREDYVKGTADIEWEMFRNEVSDGYREEMPDKIIFTDIVYQNLMSGVSNGVWSDLDCNGSSGSARVPDEIRFLGEETIRRVIGEFWEAQSDRPEALE